MTTSNNKLSADRLANIKPSATIAMVNKALALKNQGKIIINLGAGEPDFDTPLHIKEAAKRAIDAGDTKYTAVDGTAKLKEAIINKFKRDNNLTYQTNQISVSTGAKQVIYNALVATLSPGDEVVITAPYWVSYPDMVLLAEGTPVFISAAIENEFKITPEQLRSAITPKTKWFIFNSPSNPSGAAYTCNEIKALANVLLEHQQVYILSDDIYEHLVYDNFKFATIAEVEPKLYDRVLTVNGVSKTYSMTGWRIGFGAGSAELIKLMSIIQSQSTSNPCSISQAATVEALDGPQEFMQEWKLSFKDRRNMVTAMLNDIEGIDCLLPNGAFYVLPCCKKLLGKKTLDGRVIATDTDMVEYLLTDYEVVAVQGEAFGLAGYFRISYANSMDNLIEACKRIKIACDKLR